MSNIKIIKGDHHDGRLESNDVVEIKAAAGAGSFWTQRGKFDESRAWPQGEQREAESHIDDVLAPNNINGFGLGRHRA